MRKIKKYSTSLSLLVISIFLCAGCQKAALPKEVTMLVFTVQIDTDSLDLNRTEDQKVLNGWAEQSMELLHQRLNLANAHSNIVRDPAYESRLIIKTAYKDDNHKEMIKFLLGKGLIEWKLQIAGPFLAKEAVLDAYAGSIPENTEIVGGQFYVLISHQPVITSKDIRRVAAKKDSSGDWFISVTLTESAGNRMAEFSSANIGNQLVAVFDGQYFSASTIESKLSKDLVIRSALISKSEVMSKTYSIILSLPNLPVSILILDEKTVTESLE
jgi:preprotein translocase subunit SecD